MQRQPRKSEVYPQALPAVFESAYLRLRLLRRSRLFFEPIFLRRRDLAIHVLNNAVAGSLRPLTGQSSPFLITDRDPVVID